MEENEVEFSLISAVAVHVSSYQLSAHKLEHDYNLDKCPLFRDIDL